MRNPFPRVAQLRRVALPERGFALVAQQARSAWSLRGGPAATGVLPSAQLNLGVNVDEDGALVGAGLPWIAATIPFSHNDPPLVIAAGARAAEHTMTPARSEQPLVPGALAGSPSLGTDVVAGLVPLPFNDPALIVSSELVASGRLSCLDASGRLWPLAIGDVLVDRHGTGGAIAEVRPSTAMPRLADGTPVDVLVDPMQVLRRRRFGTLLEIEAAERDVFDPQTDAPIDALAGIWHVLRQTRADAETELDSEMVRLTLASAGREYSSVRPLVVDRVVPDPELASDACGVPRDLLQGDGVSSVLVIGSRPGAVQECRVVPVDDEAVRLPAAARSLFVAPWTGEPATIAPTTERGGDPIEAPSFPHIGDDRPVRRVTVAALQPPAVRGLLSEVPQRLAEIDQLFERGHVTHEERTQAALDELVTMCNKVESAFREDAASAPTSIVAQLQRAGIPLHVIMPNVEDIEGRVGGPYLADYVDGISNDVMRAATAPQFPRSTGQHARSNSPSTSRGLCDNMQVTEIDCTPPSETTLRSPLDCRAKSGVCATCVGILPGRTLALSVGAPVGLMGTIALGRVLPDLWLRTFHVCGAHLPAQHGLLRFEELVSGTRPKGAAVLAERDGVVRLDEHGLTLLDTAGAHTQTISPGPLFVVNDGANVEPGTPLTLGPVPLADLARLKGPDAVDRYVADDMISLLEPETRTVATALIECIVRALRPTRPWNTHP